MNRRKTGGLVASICSKAVSASSCEKQGGYVKILRLLCEKANGSFMAVKGLRQKKTDGVVASIYSRALCASS